MCSVSKDGLPESRERSNKDDMEVDTDVQQVNQCVDQPLGLCFEIKKNKIEGFRGSKETEHKDLMRD